MEGGRQRGRKGEREGESETVKMGGWETGLLNSPQEEWYYLSHLSCVHQDLHTHRLAWSRQSALQRPLQLTRNLFIIRDRQVELV